MVAWSFSGEGRGLLGDGQIDLTWEKKLEKLDVSKPVPLSIPRPAPRCRSFLGTKSCSPKAESLDFQENDDLKGLRPIDPQHEADRAR